MRIYLENTEGKSAKFWSVEDGYSRIYVNYGKIGTDGATKRKLFVNQVLTNMEIEKLVKSKLKSGYVEVPIPETDKKWFEGLEERAHDILRREILLQPIEEYKYLRLELKEGDCYLGIEKKTDKDYWEIAGSPDYGKDTWSLEKHIRSHENIPRKAPSGLLTTLSRSSYPKNALEVTALENFLWCAMLTVVLEKFKEDKTLKKHLQNIKVYQIRASKKEMKSFINSDVPAQELLEFLEPYVGEEGNKELIAKLWAQ